MSTLTITIPDERMTALDRLASRLGITPEELIQASLDELLKQSRPDVHQAITYVLKKNHELYKRLA